MELEHFSERMQRILLMAPLYHLGRRQFSMRNGKTLSGMELGLMTLLFFFEEMLAGKRDAGIRRLARFLQEATHFSLYESDAEYEKLAREIVAEFRPLTGKRNEVRFFDCEKQTEATAQYSYLKADKADLQSNEQYYVLDEQGLELIFATKEYFNEYQLSINQLILRMACIANCCRLALNSALQHWQQQRNPCTLLALTALIMNRKSRSVCLRRLCQ